MRRCEVAHSMKGDSLSIKLVLSRATCSAKPRNAPKIRGLRKLRFSVKRVAAKSRFE